MVRWPFSNGYSDFNDFLRFFCGELPRISDFFEAHDLDLKNLAKTNMKLGQILVADWDRRPVRKCHPRWHPAHLLELFDMNIESLSLCHCWSLNEAYFYLGNALGFIVTAFSPIRFYNTIVFRNHCCLRLSKFALHFLNCHLSFFFKENPSAFPSLFQEPLFFLLMWSKTKIWIRVDKPVIIESRIDNKSRWLPGKTMNYKFCWCANCFFWTMMIRWFYNCLTYRQ